MKLAAALLTLILVGCTHEVVRPVVLTSPCPIAPSLPTVKADELAMLSDKTYHTLVARELALRQYIVSLEVNCERK